jgi:hypothetical protein
MKGSLTLGELEGMGRPLYPIRVKLGPGLLCRLSNGKPDMVVRLREDLPDLKATSVGLEVWELQC